MQGGQFGRNAKMAHLNDQHNFIQPDFNERTGFNKKRLGVVVLIFSVIVIGYFGFKLGTKTNIIEVFIKPDKKIILCLGCD